MDIPDINDIKSAFERIKPYIHRTPLLTCNTFNRMLGCEVYFKCENFQKVGAFKVRGATNAVLSLSDEECRNGVTTHSSGNHAQAVSLAAKNRGIKAFVVMPNNSPKVKVEGVKSYGAEIIFSEPTLKDREKTLERVVRETGARFIHPYNDFKVIEGQATSAMEILEELNSPDIIMAPVGGGGLMSGTALSTHYLSPETVIIGAEPEIADDAFKSFHEGKLYPPTGAMTVADGLRTALGDKTFYIIKKFVHNIVTVSEDSIIKAMKLIWERMKVIIEPSSAVPFAALLEEKIDMKGKKIGIILSGGNVDLEELPWMWKM